MAFKDNLGFKDLKEVHGPFDIIGDVHGCLQELLLLLKKLNYIIYFDEQKKEYEVNHPQNHVLIFVGDLVDRGPNSPEVLRLVMNVVEQKKGYCVIGNHDDKLFRKLNGKNVQVRHGLEITLEQLKPYSKQFIDNVRSFLGRLLHHLLLDGGRLVIAHAGLAENLHGKNSKGVRALCLYGPTTGVLDEKGLPVRLDWAADYRGHAVVVYGHTPVQEPMWKNNTVNIDTGCVFGGKLTALTYPNLKLTSVEAIQHYADPMRPFLHPQI